MPGIMRPVEACGAGAPISAGEAVAPVRPARHRAVTPVAPSTPRTHAPVGAARRRARRPRRPDQRPTWPGPAAHGTGRTCGTRRTRRTGGRTDDGRGGEAHAAVWTAFEARWSRLSPETSRPSTRVPAPTVMPESPSACRRTSQSPRSSSRLRRPRTHCTPARRWSTPLSSMRRSRTPADLEDEHRVRVVPGVERQRAPENAIAAAEPYTPVLYVRPMKSAGATGAYSGAAPLRRTRW